MTFQEAGRTAEIFKRETLRKPEYTVYRHVLDPDDTKNIY